MSRPHDPFKKIRWDLLSRFLETRFDLLCEYLADEEEGSSPYTFREDAEELLAQVRRCSRWARIPAKSRWVIAGLVLNARRMWEAQGHPLAQVRQYLAGRVPVEYLAVALEEAFRGIPEDRMDIVGLDGEGQTPDVPMGDGALPPAPLPEVQG